MEKKLTDKKDNFIGKEVPTVILAYIPAFIFLVGISILSYVAEIPISQLTRDPMAIMKGHFYTGLLSNMGVLLWCATASNCFFSYTLLRRVPHKSEVSVFFLYFGLLTCVLLFDDLFLLHEIASGYLNINELIIPAIYGITIILGTILFKKIIFDTELVFLCLAFSFFALSLTVDALPETLLPWHHLFEDGPKFLGIVGWCGYFTTTGWKTLRALNVRQ